jgi:hypothetical protein
MKLKLRNCMLACLMFASSLLRFPMARVLATDSKSQGTVVVGPVKALAGDMNGVVSPEAMAIYKVALSAAAKPAVLGESCSCSCACSCGCDCSCSCGCSCTC